MLDNLTKLMNQFDIGESMGMGNIQGIPEEPNSTQFDHASSIPKQPFENNDMLEQSQSTNNDNPFTKRSNFLAYHTIENDNDRPSMVEGDKKFSVTNQNYDYVSLMFHYSQYRGSRMSKMINKIRSMS